jgi:hypothetical protein
MPARSGFFDPNAARRSLHGVPPRLQFHDADGGYTYVVGVRDPDTGKFVARHSPLLLPFKGAMDLGSVERGWLKLRPSYDDRHLVPLHQPVDTENPPGPDYFLALRVKVLLHPQGLAQLTAGGTIVQNSLFNVFVAYQRSSEAAAGLIPVVEFRPSRQVAVASRNGELHSAPVLVIVGWIKRDPAIFGERTVPKPVGRIEGEDGGPAAPPLAPPVAANANDATAPASPEPANDPFADMATHATSDPVF